MTPLPPTDCIAMICEQADSAVGMHLCSPPPDQGWIIVIQRDGTPEWCPMPSEADREPK